MSEFARKVAIVTGASAGIGQRTAELLVDRGAQVVIAARSESKLREIAASRGMHAVAGDVSDGAFIERLFAETESRFGPCDVLINNAGMIDPAPLLDTTPDRWERMFAVNVHSIYLACRRALPAMIQRRGGTIVNVASISGVI